MTDAVLAIVAAGTPFLEEWEKIGKSISKKSRRRNELAHHQVVVDKTEKPGKRYALLRTIVQPPPQAFDKPHIGVNELRTRIGVFKTLASEIRNFHIRFGEGCSYYVSHDQFVRTKGILDHG
jgi:hypothetical protein